MCRQGEKVRLTTGMSEVADVRLSGPAATAADVCDDGGSAVCKN